MGWDKLADLGNGIFKRWFSKESKEESRANEIEKLEKQQKDLADTNLNGSNDSKLRAISKRLSKLYTDAKNAR